MAQLVKLSEIPQMSKGFFFSIFLGTLLCLSVFMPWFNIFGMNVYVSQLSEELFPWGISMGVFAIAVTFLKNKIQRGLIHLFLGAITIFGAVVEFHSVSGLGIKNKEVVNLMNKIFGPSMHIGFYAFILASVALVLYGIWTLVQEEVL